MGELEGARPVPLIWKCWGGSPGPDNPGRPDRGMEGGGVGVREKSRHESLPGPNEGITHGWVVLGAVPGGIWG